MFNFILRNTAQIRSTLLLCAIFLLTTSAAFAQERNWKTFSPENGAWSIFAPGEMERDETGTESLNTKGGYTYTDENGFFAVVYEDSPKWLVTFSKPFINSHYKKIRNSFLKSSKGELIKDGKFSNGKNGGREFYIKIPDGRVLDSENQIKTRYRTGRFRIFFEGKRCYMLIAVLPQEEIDAFAVDNYFDSFTAKQN